MSFRNLALILCLSTQLFVAGRPAEQKNLGAAQKEGRRIFQQKCAVCHVPAYPGATALGPGLSNAILTNETAVQDTIANGLYGGPDKMPGFKYTLTPEQIQNIIDYLRTLDQPPETVVSEVPELPER
jgi:mono/diheme cytochrome c family protein